MNDAIRVVWGRGGGEAPLSAFDAALAEAGIHNYNLVTYSSVVPPERPVVEAGRVETPYEVGTPVGVVLAANEATRADGSVAAGLGWLLAEEGGVMMESSAGSAAACRADLRTKLADARRCREWDWAADPEIRVVERAAADRAGAAVVAAVYGPLSYDDAAAAGGR